MRYTDPQILEAVQAVIEDAEQIAPDADVIVDAGKLENLKRVLEIVQKNNRQARDLGYLTKCALESQQACNPRPLAVLLTAAIHTVMQTGGNPAAEQSPLVRVLLNTLLNVLGPYHSLPAYDTDVMLYHRDIEALEAYLKQEPAAA